MMKAKNGRPFLTMVGCTVLGCLVGASGAAGQTLPGRDDKPDVQTSRPLSAWEVVDLFRGKTWVWKDGGAFFDGQPRQYLAYKGEGAAATVAIGRWKVASDGTLCTSATWTFSQGNKEVTDCFDHLARDGAIFQRKKPDGQWYVLRPAPGQPGSPALVAGDSTKGKRDAAKRSIE